MKEWLVKVRHYAGGTSVVDDFDDSLDAELDALVRNSRYNATNYYVERNWNYDA